MKTNAKMKQYIDTVKTNSMMNNFTIDFTALESIIFPSFFEWDDCVLLSQLKGSELPTHFSPNQFVTDRTAFEADYNHIHLNDTFGEGVHPDSILNIGIKILGVWEAILYKQFNGRRKFMLILSYDGEDVILRFYTVRENEVPWLDTSKLELYMDGLMLIET
ncbi:hypothetical protein [Paenibacillus aquistagni]|uniref:Uncharacterized protein n=1 Tax=Paenibacillus aquistagni TaxID=1852522 RepID=A0A1X7L608_9BACL|nr:hypothetical protein [Paenibacillus aquistagni]SMG49190.1 hypothetical protein SAMN06295960_3028 [Paenibacillus aquistagni]